MTGFRAFVAFVAFLVLFGVVGHDEVSWHQLTLALAALAALFWATNTAENG
jgi:hypothetical protein